MQAHADTHDKPGYYGDRQEPCTRPTRWLGYGYGIGRCNQHAEAIIDGLRYSTRSATLIAAMDGTDFGCYLFRTGGGRYFAIRKSYPFRGIETDPLETLSLTAALRLYSDITARSYASADPLTEAFPGVEVPDA